MERIFSGGGSIGTTLRGERERRGSFKRSAVTKKKRTTGGRRSLLTKKSQWNAKGGSGLVGREKKEPRNDES